MACILALACATWALIGAVAAQSTVVVPSNSSGYNVGMNQEFYLVTYCAQLDPIPIIPLTNYALDFVPVPGSTGQSQLIITSPSMASLTTGVGVIAYMSCDPQSYSAGKINLSTLIDNTIDHVSAILLYSQTGNYCEAQSAPENFPLYSMTSIKNSTVLYTLYAANNTKPKPAVNILPQSDLSNVSKAFCHGSDAPTVPPAEPSTAVAMIILYSITGIITMLFLLIIITGAIRAHRNPEQYGPRNILGRPRQSRAKGIARAMLDTLPIVKFGEQNQEKESDIELTNGASTAAAAAADTTAVPAIEEKDEEVTAPTQEPQTESRPIAEIATIDGPAPAIPVEDLGVAQQNEHGIEHGLVCSICTEEFSRGEDTRVLPCNHKYHPACVDPWLLNVSGTCPLCRIELCPPTAGESDDADENGEATGNEEGGSSAAALGAETTGRRRNTIRSILFERGRMQHATPEERIAALRRYRDEQRSRQRSSVSGPTTMQRLIPRYRMLRGPY